MSRRSIAAALLAALACWTLPQGATVTITATQEQTIDGIGAFLLLNTIRIKDGPFYITQPWDKQWDTIAYDLGASMMRFEIPPTFLPSDGAAYDPGGSVFGMGSTRANWMHVKELIRRGCTRFIGTVWSPPCFMKYNRACDNGGVLDPAFRDKYAVFIADFVKMWKDSTGVELYGLSYANEPQFVEPYNSSIWGDNELNDIITRTAPLLAQRGVSPKIFAAEHMFWAGIGPYTNTLRNANLYAFAVHGYSDGISADYGTATDWQNLYNTCNGAGKRLWMTETTCSADILTTARRLHTSFKSGRVSGWTWWAYGDNVTSPGTDVPMDCFYATKHYSRFVRPGAVMLSCSSDQTGVWVTAFRNLDNTYTVVIINTGGGATTVDLSGSAVPSTFQKYESAGSDRVMHRGTVGKTGISIAGSSVTTLFSGPDITSIQTPYNPAAALTPAETAVTANMYTLSGRLVRTVRASTLAEVRSAAHVSRGMYRVVFYDRTGKLVSSTVLTR